MDIKKIFLTTAAGIFASSAAFAHQTPNATEGAELLVDDMHKESYETDSGFYIKFGAGLFHLMEEDIEDELPNNLNAGDRKLGKQTLKSKDDMNFMFFVAPGWAINSKMGVHAKLMIIPEFTSEISLDKSTVELGGANSFTNFAKQKVEYKRSAYMGGVGFDFTIVDQKSFSVDGFVTAGFAYNDVKYTNKREAAAGTANADGSNAQNGRASVALNVEAKSDKKFSPFFELGASVNFTLSDGFKLGLAGSYIHIEKAKELETKSDDNGNGNGQNDNTTDLSDLVPNMNLISFSAVIKAELY